MAAQYGIMLDYYHQKHLRFVFAKLCVRKATDKLNTLAGIHLRTTVFWALT
jgi:hypothetical protein